MTDRPGPQVGQVVTVRGADGRTYTGRVRDIRREPTVVLVTDSTYLLVPLDGGYTFTPADDA